MNLWLWMEEFLAENFRWFIRNVNFSKNMPTVLPKNRASRAMCSGNEKSHKIWFWCGNSSWDQDMHENCHWCHWWLFRKLRVNLSHRNSNLTQKYYEKKWKTFRKTHFCRYLEPNLSCNTNKMQKYAKVILVIYLQSIKSSGYFELQTTFWTK
jgi:hypothetical protein